MEGMNSVSADFYQSNGSSLNKKHKLCAPFSDLRVALSPREAFLAKKKEDRDWRGHWKGTWRIDLLLSFCDSCSCSWWE
ncbi:hypothetical protein AXF42_Ash000720 [Apostasia shenzhenica]|uniref:Uncharacterized protein n=1 Tax=Apostasia shenzhenica TaxID=1088818 RepID=A0A2I0AHA0_9ASPA|nr:hypothetical protein AXF42_Ash000720 [Apostasia shenzhenica]